MLKRIADEMKLHAPFTATGAATGIGIMAIIIFAGALPQVSQNSYTVFYILHPAHIVLSAMVTTAIYKKYGDGKIWKAVIIGYFGSIGIATLSDSVIPYLGETMLGLENRGIHLGFIEEPLLTHPAAFIGTAIGYRKPATRFPHYGHVLLSTWASLFHVLMALGATVSWVVFPTIFGFLFLAVWLPCCTSDIVFPLLFIRGARGRARADHCAPHKCL